MLGVAVVGLTSVLSATPSSAAGRAPDPCHLLTTAEAGVVLGETPVSARPLGRSACVYSPSIFTYTSSSSSGSTSTRAISVLEQTGSKAVRDFYRLGSADAGGEGSPRPRRFHIDGVLTYYNGLVSGMPSVTFHSLSNGVVIGLSIPKAPGTPLKLGKQAMAEVLENFAH
jgi:hypothetical protein